MFETMIVPLDGSPHAEVVLPYAIDEAGRHGATIVLIHVIPRPEPCTSLVRRSGPLPWQGEWPFEDLEENKQDANDYLRGVVRRYALDPDTPLCVAVGDPGVRVAAEAARRPQPLVVVLTGDRTREAHPSLSLVTSRLLVAGAVPVLSIRQPLPHEADGGATGAPRSTHLRLTRPGPALAPGSPPPAPTR
jgi:nucleotide-binding universal stress UspA family protein